MPTVEGFEGSIPEEMANKLDFISSFGIIALSFVFKRLGLIQKEHIPGWRSATFNFALPALNLMFLWQAEITSEIAIILLVALVTAISTMIFAFAISHITQGPSQGFYAMAACGNSISFAYPCLMASERFGAKTITAAVMMELGGNVWCAVLYYAFAGKMFSPAAKKLDNVQSKYVVTDGVSPAPECIPPFTSFEASPDLGKRDRSASSGVEGAQQSNVPLDEPSMLRILLKNMLLWAIALGLFLNVVGAPYYAVPGKSLQMLGAMFGPLLYAIIGAELQFDIDFQSAGSIVGVLIARWMSNALAVGIVRLIPWGLDPQIRGALTLVVLTPVPSSFIMYADIYKYRSDHAAVIYSIAAIVSLTAMSALAPVA